MKNIYKLTTLTTCLLICFFAAAQTDVDVVQHMTEACRTEGHKQLREEIRLLKQGGPADEAERNRIVDSLYNAKALYKSQKAQPRGGGGVDTILPPSPLSTAYTFADGRLKGRFSLNYITNNQDGVRLDRTVYDSTTNHIYALNTMGNLVDGPLVHEGSLLRRNQRVIIFDGGFTGVKLPNGGFRLVAGINQNWAANSFYYSDDHGMTWIASEGAEFTTTKVYWTETMANGDILTRVSRIVNGANHTLLLLSTDLGKTFSVLKGWNEAEGSRFVSTKLYNTADGCLIIRKIANQDKWEIYQYDNRNISLLTTWAVNKVPATMTGTNLNGWKFYVGVDGEGGFYSNGGFTFEWRPNIFKNLETVVPTNPNIVFSREAQHDYTADGGFTWQKYPNNNGTTGWDPKHLTFYQKRGGAWFFAIANDMGLTFNSNLAFPTPTADWKYVNNDHSYAILHGGVAHDSLRITVTGNQDPGTFELRERGAGKYFATKRQGADGLRATFSNDGKAYWYRHYWEQFFHFHTSTSGDTRAQAATTVTGPSTWYTPPFKGTTKPNEDAIWVTGYDRLKKLTYTTVPTANSISQSELPFDFKTQAGDVTWGIGVSKTDPNRLYVATKNKRFFISRDMGQTWTETSYTGAKPNFPSLQYNQSAGYYIEVADNNPDVVYWGSQSGPAACLVSTDGGVTFRPNVTGLPSGENVQSISLSPKADVIFSSNFYVYFASQNRWYPMFGSSMPTGIVVKSVQYLPIQKKVRYFTWGAGILDFDISHLDAGSITNTTDMTMLSDQINIFPNPAQEVVNIELVDGRVQKGEASIYLVNALGQIVFHNKQPVQSTMQIPVRGLPTGLYTIRLILDHKMVATKPVVISK